MNILIKIIDGFQKLFAKAGNGDSIFAAFGFANVLIFTNFLSIIKIYERIFVEKADLNKTTLLIIFSIVLIIEYFLFYQKIERKIKANELVHNNFNIRFSIIYMIASLLILISLS